MVSDLGVHITPARPIDGAVSDDGRQITRIPPLTASVEADEPPSVTGSTYRGRERGDILFLCGEVLPGLGGSAIIIDPPDPGPAIGDASVVGRESDRAPRGRGACIEAEGVGVLRLEVGISDISVEWIGRLVDRVEVCRWRSSRSPGVGEPDSPGLVELVGDICCWEEVEVRGLEGLPGREGKVRIQPPGPRPYLYTEGADPSSQGEVTGVGILVVLVSP